MDVSAGMGIDGVTRMESWRRKIPVIGEAYFQKFLSFKI